MSETVPLSLSCAAAAGSHSLPLFPLRSSHTVSHCSLHVVQWFYFTAKELSFWVPVPAMIPAVYRHTFPPGWTHPSGTVS